MDEKLIDESCVAMKYAYYTCIKPNQTKLDELNKKYGIKAVLYQLSTVNIYEHSDIRKFGGFGFDCKRYNDNNYVNYLKISWDIYVNLYFKFTKHDRENQLMLVKLYGPNSEVAKEAESHFSNAINELENLEN